MWWCFYWLSNIEDWWGNHHFSGAHIKSPLGSSVSCLNWSTYCRLYSLYHNLALYCKPWQNWMKICLLSSISWSFYKDILEHKVHIWIFIKPFFVKLVQMFYSASRDRGLYVLLNSFTLGLQFAVASARSLAVNLSTDEQTVLKGNDTSKAGVVFFGCVLSEDKLWPAGYTFFELASSKCYCSEFASFCHANWNKQRLLVISRTCLWGLLD